MELFHSRAQMLVVAPIFVEMVFSQLLVKSKTTNWKINF